MTVDDDEQLKPEEPAQDFFRRLLGDDPNDPPGVPAYRTRLAQADTGPIGNSADQAANPRRGRLRSLAEAWNRNDFVTPERTREENRAAGGEPLHVIYTDPATGNVTEQWLMKATTTDGHTVEYPHRLGGLPATTVRNSKGIVLTEEYAEWGVPTPRPDGLMEISRDPNTGVGVRERRLKDGVETYVERDPQTGIVTYQDRLRNGKLEAAVWRDRTTGTDIGQRGRNRDGEQVGTTVQPAPPGTPISAGSRPKF